MASREDVKKVGKVIILGMDGLDPAVMDLLMSEGLLPHFSKLKETGSYARLATTNPAVSPVAWTTLATGAGPGVHGIFDFIERRAPSYLPLLSVNRLERGLLGKDRHVRCRRAPAFWEKAGKAGVPCVILRWPVTFPPEEINGRMLSGLGVPDLLGLLGKYSYLTSQDEEARPEDYGRLIRLEHEGGAFRADLVGPRVQGFLEQRDTACRIRIGVDESTGTATVSVGEKGYRVPFEGWSDWVPVSFRIAPGKTAEGLARFYCLETQPHVKLYATPTQIDPRNPFYAISHPGGYAAELAAEVGPFHTLGIAEDTKALEEGRLGEEAFLEQCRMIIDEREHIFLHELGRFEEGILACVFDTSDRIQHVFWRENEYDEEGKLARVAGPIREHCVRLDGILGKAMEEAGNDAAVIVVSDHGFTGFRWAFDMNRWLVTKGYMGLTGEPPEGSSGPLFQYVDWSKTQAYALGFASVYLNLQGREEEGIVRREEANELKGALIRELVAFRHEDRGVNPVFRVYWREEIYAGPEAGAGPDLIVGFRPGYRMSGETALGGIASSIITIRKSKWRGDHIVDPGFVPGVFLSNLAGAVEGPFGAEDVAPLILRLLGVEETASQDR